MAQPRHSLVQPAMALPEPAKFPAPRAPDKPQPLRLVVREVELEKLHKIDIANQSFHATIWVPFIVEGGALDKNLTAKGAIFPIGEDGKPTFKPSAEWFLAQVIVYIQY